MKQLIKLLEPNPLESLLSFLERLRRVNYYEEQCWYSDLLPSRPAYINLLQDKEQFSALAMITRLSEDEIYNLTLHRFAELYIDSDNQEQDRAVRSEEGRWLWTHAGHNQYIHGQWTKKICPLCYMEHESMLLPWSLRHVTACPFHQILLVDKCNICQLPLRRVSGQCAHCKNHLILSKDIEVTDAEDVWLTSLVWSAVGCSDVTFSTLEMLSSPNPLNELHSSSLLVFLWKIGELLLDCEQLEEYTYRTRKNSPKFSLRHIDNNSVHGLLKRVSRIFVQWPDAWYELLERFAWSDGQRLEARTPYLFTRWFMGAQWNWLHKSWETFMQEHYGHLPNLGQWVRYYRVLQQDKTSAERTFLSRREAAHALRLSEESFAKRMGKQALPFIHRRSRNGQRDWRYMEVKHLLKFKAVRDAEYTLQMTAKYCGISKDQIVVLVKARLLTAEQGPLLDGSGYWIFDKLKLDAALEILVGHLPVKPIGVGSEHSTIVLRDVLRIGSGQGLRLPEILVAIRDQILPCVRAYETKDLWNLWFKQDDLMKYLAERRKAQGALLLSVSQVCERLQCKPTTLYRLYTSGLLFPLADSIDTEVPRQYLEEDVVAFQERYISSDEAAKILGVTQLTVQSWVRLGRLIAVTGPEIDGSHAYRFDKLALQAWRHERLTVGQTMALLNISKATLHRWVEQGKLKPLANMGGKQRWFLREEVEELKGDKSSE